MSISPVQCRLPDDLPSIPSELFRRLRHLPGVFWLDSGRDPSDHGRYHYLGANPVEVLSDSGTSSWRHLETAAAQKAAAATHVPAARWVGYFAYDLGTPLENVPSPAAVNEAPELYLARYSASITFDMVTGEATVTGDDNTSIEQLISCLRADTSKDIVKTAPVAMPTHMWTYERFEAAVSRAKEYIAAGDVYQVNLSHRFEAELGDVSAMIASEIYIRLRRKHVAPYGAFLQLIDTEQ